jgi:hypothetical protein
LRLPCSPRRPPTAFHRFERKAGDGPAGTSTSACGSKGSATPERGQLFELRAGTGLISQGVQRRDICSFGQTTGPPTNLWDGIVPRGTGLCAKTRKRAPIGGSCFAAHAGPLCPMK